MLRRKRSQIASQSGGSAVRAQHRRRRGASPAAAPAAVNACKGQSFRVQPFSTTYQYVSGARAMRRSVKCRGALNRIAAQALIRAAVAAKSAMAAASGPSATRNWIDPPVRACRPRRVPAPPLVGYRIQASRRVEGRRRVSPSPRSGEATVKFGVARCSAGLKAGAARPRLRRLRP